MAWRERVKKWDWRSFLTADERRVVRALERALARHRKEAAGLAADLSPIRNRAIQRAKCAAARGV
jgi:hypothetical protein